MSATLPPPESRTASNRDPTLEALNRGELVRLLAELDAGKITPEQFEAAMERHERRGWFRRIIAAIFGQ